jgi:hypothetical protein
LSTAWSIATLWIRPTHSLAIILARLALSLNCRFWIAPAYRSRILRAVEAWAFLTYVIRLGNSLPGASKTGGRSAT